MTEEKEVSQLQTQEQVEELGKKSKKQITMTKRIVFTAVFAALAYAISYLEFFIFPAANFLKLDFSAVFITLAAFMFGPIAGVATCGIKELICFFTKPSFGGIGELANFVIISAFILIPSIVYYFRKGLPLVIITLSCACVVQVALAMLVNRFINFPLACNGDLTMAAQMFSSLWVYVLLFNLIKSVAISVLTILLYKRLSQIIKSI